MNYSYVYFSDGRIFRDGIEGFLTESPALPVPIRMLSWGSNVDQFYLDMEGARYDLNDEQLALFTDAIVLLISEDSFELGNLYIERSSLRSKLEATDYIEMGVDNGYFAEADYIGVLNDRQVWMARLEEIEIRISEIESLANPN